MTTMSAGQLAIMAVAMIGALAVWLSLVFLAEREQGYRRHGQGETLAVGPPRENAEAAPGSRAEMELTPAGPRAPAGHDRAPQAADDQAPQAADDRIPQAIGAGTR